MKAALIGGKEETRMIDDGRFYLDRQGLEGVGLLLRGRSVVWTGTSVHREPEAYRASDVLEPLRREGFFLFFGEEGPRNVPYAVPALVLLGHDGRGGYFATAEGEEFSFQNDALLLYISPELQPYRIRGGSARLMTGEYAWRKDLEPLPCIHVYASRRLAEADFPIHDAGEIARLLGEKDGDRPSI